MGCKQYADMSRQKVHLSFSRPFLLLRVAKYDTGARRLNEAFTSITLYYMTGGCCRWVCQRAFLSKSPPAPPQKNSGSLHCQLCNLNQKKVCNVAWCHSVDAQSREMNVWDTLNARGWWWNVSVGKDSHHSAHFAIILQRSNCSGKYNVAKIPLWPFVGQMLFHR